MSDQRMDQIDETDAPDEWRELQKHWRAILFDMPQATCVEFIRDTVNKTELPVRDVLGLRSSALSL